VVYGREVSGRTLTFGVSGKLWRNSLIMYDRETGSEWSQITGKAISGPMKGKRLRKLAASDRSTRFVDWIRRHPGVQVLQARGMTTPGGDTYRLYHSGDETGIRNLETLDARLPDKMRVVGIEVGGGAYTIPPSLLPEGTSRTFRTDAGDVSLRLTPTGIQLISAPPSGAEALRVYWFVWRDFHPGSRILSAQDLVE